MTKARRACSELEAKINEVYRYYNNFLLKHVNLHQGVVKKCVRSGGEGVSYATFTALSPRTTNQEILAETVKFIGKKIQK